MGTVKRIMPLILWPSIVILLVGLPGWILSAYVLELCSRAWILPNIPEGWVHDSIVKFNWIFYGLVLLLGAAVIAPLRTHKPQVKVQKLKSSGQKIRWDKNKKDIVRK